MGRVWPCGDLLHDGADGGLADRVERAAGLQLDVRSLEICDQFQLHAFEPDELLELALHVPLFSGQGTASQEDDGDNDTHGEHGW